MYVHVCCTWSSQQMSRCVLITCLIQTVCIQIVFTSCCSESSIDRKYQSMCLKYDCSQSKLCLVLVCYITIVISSCFIKSVFVVSCTYMCHQIALHHIFHVYRQFVCGLWLPHIVSNLEVPVIEMSGFKV